MKKDDILIGIANFIRNKRNEKIWIPGKDFVNYAGPYFDEHEILVAVSTLLDGWLVMGDQSVKFEKLFPKQFGNAHQKEKPFYLFYQYQKQQLNSQYTQQQQFQQQLQMIGSAGGGGGGGNQMHQNLVNIDFFDPNQVSKVLIIIPVF